MAKLLSTFGVSSVIILLKAGIFRRAISSPSTCLVNAPCSKHRKASGYKLFTVSTRISCICHPGPRWVLRYCFVFLRVSLQAGAGLRHRTYFILSKGRDENAVLNVTASFKAIQENITEFSHFHKTPIAMLQRALFGECLPALNFIRSKRSVGKSGRAIR